MWANEPEPGDKIFSTGPNAPEKIVDMLAKLHILKNNAGTPEEAATAASMYQKQMLKWTVDEYTVLQRASELHGGTASVPLLNFEHNRVMYARDGEKECGFMWQNTILAGCASTGFCRVVMDGVNGEFGTLMGTRTHMLVCMELFEYLRAEVLRLCERRFKAYQKLVGFKLRAHEAYDFRKSYCLGAAAAIRTIMEGNFKREQKMTDNGNAIVLITDALEEYKKDLFPKTVSMRHQRGNKAAYTAGYKDGTRINLSRQIDPHKTALKG